MKAKDLYHGLAFLGKTQQNWAFSSLVGKDYGEVFLDNPIIDLEEEKLKQLKKDYKKGIPLAHILGESYFYGRRFCVNSDVLIPRPETEGLVERALGLSWNSALDLCTGSGIIATTLYLEKGGEIAAVDLSERALDVAKKNAQNLGAKVEFSKGDLFQGLGGKFDIIVSNPPYIKKEALEDLEVSHFDPPMALDGGDDGLELLGKIIDEAPNYLNPQGYLLLEIGDDQGDQVLCLAQGFYGRIEVDLAGKPRYFIGRKKEICSVKNLTISF